MSQKAGLAPFNYRLFSKISNENNTYQVDFKLHPFKSGKEIILNRSSGYISSKSCLTKQLLQLYDFIWA